MARGGKRTGTPGKSYSNRSDMNQPIKVAPGQEYGEGKAMADAQRTIPLPNNVAVPAPLSPAAANVGGPGPPALPGQSPFMRPTERPMEPVTSGIPGGAGPGPEVLMSQGPANDDIGVRLRALYQAAPNNDLLRLIELHDNGY